MFRPPSGPQPSILFFFYAAQGCEGPILPEQTYNNRRDSELALLERVQEAVLSEGKLTQRDLARSSGLSLGMTNALLKRLMERGWLLMKRSSIRSVRYVLTPEGVAELVKRSIGFIRQASENASRYRDRIDEFITKAKTSGVRTIVLVGPSEADFILETVCANHGISFVKSADIERAQVLAKRPDVSLVFGEGMRSRADGFGLDAMMLGQSGAESGKDE